MMNQKKWENSHKLLNQIKKLKSHQKSSLKDNRINRKGCKEKKHLKMSNLKNNKISQTKIRSNNSLKKFGSKKRYCMIKKVRMIPIYQETG